jgi:hypothetical protein
MKMVIIGGGLAGAMAFNYFRRFNPELYEAKKEPEKHRAILRIKDSQVGVILGCPMKEIEAERTAYYGGKLNSKANITASNQYSIKVSDSIKKRSISNLGKVKRFIMDGKINLKGSVFGAKLYRMTEVGKMLYFSGNSSKQNCFVNYDICINTIPLPSLLQIGGINLSEKFDLQNTFKSQQIFVLSYGISIDVDVCQTIYFPEPEYNIYRASIENKRLIIESVDLEPNIDEIMLVEKLFGLNLFNVTIFKDGCLSILPFGKIINMDNDIRRLIILKLTERYNIYSLGRYATWKSIRLDDLVSDLKRIENMIAVSNIKNEYNRRKEA